MAISIGMLRENDPRSGRQKSRLRGNSVWNPPAEQAKIVDAMEEALKMDPATIVSPYSCDGAATAFISALDGIADWPSLLRKPFHDL